MGLTARSTRQNSQPVPPQLCNISHTDDYGLVKLQNLDLLKCGANWGIRGDLVIGREERRASLLIFCRCCAPVASSATEQGWTLPGPLSFLTSTVEVVTVY